MEKKSSSTDLNGIYVWGCGNNHTEDKDCGGNQMNSASRQKVTCGSHLSVNSVRGPEKISSFSFFLSSSPPIPRGQVGILASVWIGCMGGNRAKAGGTGVSQYKR